LGITNELFQTERDETPSCQFASVPNDVQNMDATTVLESVTAIENFANFQRFLAPPIPSPDTPEGRAPSRTASRSSPRLAARCATPLR
jgi:hypothetical protein